jgi:hypothetical protein
MITMDYKEVSLNTMLLYLQSFIVSIFIVVKLDWYILSVFILVPIITIFSFLPKIGLIIRIFYITIYILIGYLIGGIDSGIYPYLYGFLGLIIGLLANFQNIREKVIDKIFSVLSR